MSSKLYVNLKRLDHNLRAVNDRIGKGVQRMAVVKDNAYGHGAIEVAGYLEEKVEWFCVARLPEAVELREKGIKRPILVFEIPPLGSENIYRDLSLTASISSLSVFERLQPGTSCHLHFDTGMFRLGMLPSEVSLALHKMQEYKLDYNGIYMHYANSDIQDHPSVFDQLQLFRSIRSQFPEELMTHTCNSGGIFFYHDKEVLFDAVRPGVCLYGYAPGKDAIPELQPIIEWKSHLVQVKEIKAGDSVGYGSRWTAEEDGWLGIIPVGYADGVSRSLSGQFEVGIDGQFYPQVGTISMDYMAVHLGQHKLKEGETVTLLGKEHLTAVEWANKIGTIPYEITTSISPKVDRKYILD